MLTVLAFVVALGLLIAVHEYGHYRVAVACGVKVLRFSVGFGKTLYRWQPARQKPGQNTEFVIGAFPLGGYVKMLDEREGPVDPAERHLAFNNRPLSARAAIVAAGPAANLLLAIVLYAGVSWYGVQEPKAILASPVADSVAQRAGLRGGERIEKAAFEGQAPEPVRSFEDLRWLLMRGALDQRDVRLELSQGRQLLLPLSQLESADADEQLVRKIGILSPWTAPVIGEVMDKGAAQRAGLQRGDVVLSISGTPVIDGQQLRELIRTSVSQGRGDTRVWQIRREGKVIELTVTADAVQDKSQLIGRINAFVGGPPEFVTVNYGPLEGLWKGTQRTWEISWLTLRMMGRMLIGEASLKNISGPVTIASYAGKSASMGLIQYLTFLAYISVSLGVLNLLPLPVLDGGHLMYYLWEAVTGRGVSDAWMERLQKGGIAVLLLMMSIALFNDVTRLFG